MEMKKYGVLLALLILTGCAQKPRTALMRKMEQAGAGDLRTVTSQAIEQWFLRNPGVAFEVNRTCRDLRANAPATWGDTTDGRICSAAARVHFFYHRFQAGSFTFYISK